MLRALVLGASCLTGAIAASAQPVPMRGLSFTEHRGQPLAAATLRGRPVLLHFVFTSCAKTCSTQVGELAALRRALPDDVRERVRFVSMTVDPLQDTPRTLASFASGRGADLPGWYFTTGRPAQVHAFMDRMQALSPRDPRPENHRTSLYLYGADGELVQRYAGVPVDQPRLVAELTQVSRGSPR